MIGFIAKIDGISCWWSGRRVPAPEDRMYDGKMQDASLHSDDSSQGSLEMAPVSDAGTRRLNPQDIHSVLADCETCTARRLLAGYMLPMWRHKDLSRSHAILCMLSEPLDIHAMVWVT